MMPRCVDRVRILVACVFAIAGLCVATELPAQIIYSIPYYIAGGGSAGGPPAQCQVELGIGATPEQAAQAAVANNNSVMDLSTGLCPDGQPNSCCLSNGVCHNPVTFIRLASESQYIIGSPCWLPDETTGRSIQAVINAKQSTCDGSNVSDPCNLASGGVHETETDFQVSGHSGLRFVRYYNSVSANSHLSMLGPYWQTNYDLFAPTDVSADGTPLLASIVQSGPVHFMRRAGQVLTYTYDVTTQQWIGDPDIVETVVELVDPSGYHVGWRLYNGDGSGYEVYSSAGLLTQIVDSEGFAQTLTYSIDRDLLQVTDAWGRMLRFSYYPNSHVLSTLTTPNGEVYQYQYDVDSTNYRHSSHLRSVTYPSAASPNPKRIYDYNYPSSGAIYPPVLLNQVTDENQAVYATWGYSGQSVNFSALGAADSSIGRTTIVYNSDGTASVIDPLNQGTSNPPRTYTFVDDGYGIAKFASVDTPCNGCDFGNSQARTYDASGYVHTDTDFNGRTTCFTYDDAHGLEIARTEGVQNNRVCASPTMGARTTQTDWDVVLRKPLERRVYNATVSNVGLEAKTRWVYNARGQVVARCTMDPADTSGYVCSNTVAPPSNAKVRRWVYAYCDSIGTGCPILGLLKSTDGPRADVSDVTTYAYYPSTDLSGCSTLGSACHNLGDLQSVTNALGQTTTTISYDKNGRVTRLQDANGVLTDMTYHPRGWLLTRTVRANANGTPSALDATTTFSYDNVGNVTRVTQPDGTYLHYVYDTAHRLSDIYDSATPSNYLAGNHIHYTLDAAGNRIDEKTTDPSGTLKRELSRNYDRLNRLTALLNSSNLAVQTYTNPADAPSSGITYTDGYDGNGNAIYSIDGTSAHVGTEQQYDPLNRLIKTLQDHAGTGATRDTTTQYAYDTRDNLRSVIDPDGLVTSYTYDGLNNLTDLNSPDTGHAAYAYNAAGNRTKQVDARGITSTYSYDALNRLSGIAYPTASLNITYAYDQPATGCYNVGRLTKITDSSGSTTYCYDLRGNVLKKAQVTGTTTLTTSYTYSVADRLASVTYPSRLAVTYTRDSVGRIASMAYTTSAGTTSPLITSLRYLPFGPLNGITFKNGRTLTKTYDTDYAIDKVVSSAATGLIVDAAVDVLGNLMSASKTVGATPPTQQYLYDPLYRLTTIENGTGTSLLAFTYDSTGDRLSKTPQGQTRQAYTYTPNTHRLASVASAARQYDATGNTISIGTTKFSYDDRNRRVTAGTTTYNYNGRGERVAKGTTRFVYAESGQLLGEYTSTGTVQKEYLWLDGIPVAMAASGTLYYIETDQLGTPRQVIKPATTTASDTTVWKWDYFANNAAFGENAPALQTVTFNLRFPGQYFDSETGLSYNYFRDYEPGTGRYVESDPIGLDGGLNTYGYTADNSYRYIDQTGLTPKDWNRVCDDGVPSSYGFCSPYPRKPPPAPECKKEGACLNCHAIRDSCLGSTSTGAALIGLTAGCFIRATGVLDSSSQWIMTGVIAIAARKPLNDECMKAYEGCKLQNKNNCCQ